MTTAHLVRSLLDYEPETGVLRWREARSNVQEGAIAGSVTKRGYRQIMVCRRLYYAHRIAWLHMYGNWPSSGIDHINGNKDDNRRENLREADTSLNQQNIRHPKQGSISGLLGVQIRGQRFRAKIAVNGNQHYIGTFDTAEQAHTAYLGAKRRLHVGCTI